MKIIIVLALVAVIAALAGAGVFMLRKGGPQADADHPDKRMARALAMRVALSIGVFLFVLLAWWMGWIQPTGLPTGR